MTDMTDRELIVRRLKKLTKAAHHEMSDFCYISVGTANVIVRLLEEQERSDVVRCKDCRWWHPDYKQQKGYCGQANGMTEKQPTWFCADGERRDNDD